METENLPRSLHEYVESIDLRLKRLQKPAAPEATREECLISDIMYMASMLAVRTSKEEMGQGINHRLRHPTRFTISERQVPWKKGTKMAPFHLAG
jgi:hypothetical protein